MEVYNSFLLQLMLGIRKGFKYARWFSARPSPRPPPCCGGAPYNTPCNRSVRQSDIGLAGYGFGGALTKLNRSVLREGSTRSIVAIIISDASDSGRTEIIERQMRALRHRVRTVVWINPMDGASSFEPRVQGTEAALPSIDRFLPAYDAQPLQVWVRELARV